MRRAGKIDLGETATGAAVRAGRARLLLLAADASENARKRAEGYLYGRRALLVLPDGDSPILTRELLYTGITRASKEVVLWSTPAVTRLMLERRTRRASGLQARLAEA